MHIIYTTRYLCDIPLYSTKQILGVYFGSLFDAIVIGIPVGYLLCKLCASATSFLKFSFGDTHFYKLTWGMLLYSLIAAVIAILFITLPVLKYAKNSIVEQKSKLGKVNTKPIWEKAFLDVDPGGSFHLPAVQLQ